MSNLRIVSNNVADTGTTTATGSGSLVSANLRQDTKALVLRAPGLSSRISQIFTAPQLIGFAGLAYTNLSPTATMRVRTSSEVSNTNLLSMSEALEDASYTKADTTVGNNTIAPDGTYSARSLVDNTNNVVHTASRSFTVAAATTYTFSQLVKANGRTRIRIANTTLGAQADINLTTGLVTAGTGTGFVSASVTASLFGFYRVSLTFTTTTSAAHTLMLYLADASGNTVFVGSGAAGVYTWGWQLETGTLSSYYPSLHTFTSRASVGTYLDANGLIATAASGVARQQYQYPSLTGVAPRLLVEAAATNLMLYSELTSNAAHTKSGVTVGAAATSPTGAATALALSETATNAVHSISESIALTTGVTYAYSVYVKSTDIRRVQLSNTTLGAFANFNLTTGVVVSTGGTGYVDSKVDLLPNGYARLTLTFTAAATSSQALTLLLADATGNTTYLGAGLVLYAWGFQLEVGRFATSYISTTSATVARVADAFTSAAGTRPLGYMDWWQSYGYDSGAVLCCPAPAQTVDGYTAAQSASLYQFGGGVHARAWFTPVSATAVAIDVVDTANLQGYVEFSRLILGNYWEPAKNADYGVTTTPKDLTKNSRTDAGDLISDIGARYDAVTFTLSKLDPPDRTQAWKLLRSKGISRSVFLSIYPNDTDTTLEASHQVYGRLVTVPSMATPFFNLASASLEVEGV